VPVTCEAGKQGEGTAPAVPRPGSVDVAVQTLFAQIRPIVVMWAGEQRIEGSVKAHDSFDGILAEHALALEEARDMLREALVGTAGMWQVPIRRAEQQLTEQITYVRSLGSVAQKEETDAG
jgi:hypothetical protein